MGIRSDWPLLVVMVVPLTLAAYGRRLAQSAPTTAQSSAADRQDDGSVRILKTPDSCGPADLYPQGLRRFRTSEPALLTTWAIKSWMAQGKIQLFLAELFVNSGQ